LNHGLKVPADVSVAGFGNILISEHCQVPLTTVRQPKLRLGATAMALLLKWLQQGERPESRRLGCDLVIRQSTGPVPRAG
jgi:DNA-binding LacI/PurR family transcriptional regulator